ncbi:MAG: hypothetical protein IJS45_07515 [Clostridia bacterium]|nr:hypothetical protein [Clostridia bacterium]
MRKRSEKWAKMAVRGKFTFDAKARINGKDYDAISAPAIDRTLMISPLSVGGCNSATLHLSVLTDDTIPKGAEVKILGRLRDESTATDWKEFGTFYVNQRDTSFEGLVVLDCFDAMLKANQPYADNLVPLTGTGRSMKAAVQEIAYNIGVGIDPRTVIKTGGDYFISLSVLESSTMAQVLTYIGACHGGNWIITEENLLRLVPLTTAPDETFYIIDEDYHKIKTAEGHLLIYKEQQVYNAVLPLPSGDQPPSQHARTYYITDERDNRIKTPEGHLLIYDDDLNAIIAVGSDENLINIPVVCGKLTYGSKLTISKISISDNEGNEYTSGNDTGATLTIDSNPCATQTICTDLYNAYNGLVYFPFTATKALYDPAVELGDQVKIGDKVHSVIQNMKLTLDHNFRSDIDAPNSQDLSDEYPYLSKIKRTTAELKAAIEETASELNDKASNTELQAALTRISGLVSDLADSIDDEEDRAAAAENVLSGLVSSLQSSVAGIQSSITDITSRLTALENAAGGGSEPEPDPNSENNS